jgi:hypothetical protein
MFRHFGKRAGFRSITMNTGYWENIQPFGETDNIHFTREDEFNVCI